MNYRHAFHAGNFADVMKHACLVAILNRLLQKPKPITVMETHAGIGLYDLSGDEAQRTREAVRGIDVLLRSAATGLPPNLQRYVEMVLATRTESMPHAYPGSPALSATMLREEDRLMLCELHPQDAETLKHRYRRDGRVGVHHRNGYEAVGALLPPTPRRGLLLIDPPFERTDENTALVRACETSLLRWPQGTIIVWYPIKARGPVDALLGELASLAPKGLFCAETLIHGDLRADRLNGSGIAVLNPPWQADSLVQETLRPLAMLLNLAEPPSLRWIVQPEG